MIIVDTLPLCLQVCYPVFQALVLMRALHHSLRKPSQCMVPVGVFIGGTGVSNRILLRVFPSCRGCSSDEAFPSSATRWLHAGERDHGDHHSHPLRYHQGGSAVNPSLGYSGVCSVRYWWRAATWLNTLTM